MLAFAILILNWGDPVKEQGYVRVSGQEGSLELCEVDVRCSQFPFRILLGCETSRAPGTEDPGVNMYSCSLVSSADWF